MKGNLNTKSEENPCANTRKSDNELEDHFRKSNLSLLNYQVKGCTGYPHTNDTKIALLMRAGKRGRKE